MSAVAPSPDVVRLITRLNIGGPARHALLLSRELNDEFPTLLAAGRPADDEGEMSDPAVVVRHVPLVRPVRPAVDVRAFRVVRRLLTETQPRIVHTHMAKAGLVGRLAAVTLRRRPRIVHTYHGHVLSGYFSRPVERTFLELERWLARGTDVLVAVSEEVRDSLLELGVGRPSQYRVIPLGLDLLPYLAVNGKRGELRASIGLGMDVPLVGVLGRLVPIKDHAMLIDAMAEVPGAHLVVIGDGELRGELEQRVRARGLEHRIHFTGWWDDVASALADVDLVALSSRNEGTPVALIEAHAAGKPAVATHVGGVASVVRGGVTGELVNAGDPQMMAAALRHLLADANSREKMGLAGRRHVIEQYDSTRLLEHVRQLYLTLISTRGGS